MTSPESMLKMQRQIRENATELQDYLHDLDSWEEEIKKKDETFKQMKPSTQVKAVPPPRSVAAVKKKTSAESKAKPKKLKSYDYRSWDKLDVDKMMEDMDADEEEEKKEVKKQMELDFKQLSLEEKTKGNDHLKHGRYDKAVECYTKGMQYDPENAVLPANRALAFLKLEKYIETEADCTLSLSMDPTYIKAYLRRGSARKAMTKIEGAIRDFKDVLKLEPDNKQARNELNIIENQGKSESKKVSTSHKFSGDDKGNLVLPIKKPLHLQSKKPLRRIHVEEVGGEIKNPKVAECNQKQDIDISRMDSTETKNPSQDMKTLKPTNGQMKPVLNGQSHQTETTVPGVPSTFYQFQADIRKIGHNRTNLFKYVKQIDPKLFPKLIKEQLETNILSAILGALMENIAGNENFIVEFLTNLTKVKRFEMAVMFLSKSDQQGELSSVFKKCNSNFLF
uniref:RNA polymerase II-associated protein 3 n=1 Tax=Phallusia mammillata TaxID=59560 RepID=A0A6F9DRU4_9ASCI|nr:RNA polymerase II-associated protein 3-like [Phallusia mammillata]